METRSAFTALRHRNFRLLWLGQAVSLTGSAMQNAAILWHVSLLVPGERRALALGLVGLVRVAPIVLLSLWSGAAADALDRRRLMLLTQTGLGLVAAVLAALTLAGTVTVGTVYVLAALGAAAGSLDGPARQALVPALVPRADLPNAVGLNTIMFQVAAVAGPSLAGIVIATLSVGATYALNAASFLAVIVALARMRDLPPRAPVEPGALGWRAVREGLRFVFSTPLIRSTMLLDGLATFFASATALLPLFAQDVLRVGPTGYGWLYAAPSAGALVASAVMVRQVDRIGRRGTVLLWAVAAYGAATVAFGLSGALWLSVLALAATGAADTVSMVLRGVIRQLETPDHLRGRMVGVNMVFFMGGPQLGELEAGLVAQWLGPVVAVVTGGLGCLAATGWIGAATPALRGYRAAR